MTQRSRREFLQAAAAAGTLAALPQAALAAEAAAMPMPLQEFGYEQIQLRGTRQVAQRNNVSAILLALMKTAC